MAGRMDGRTAGGGVRMGARCGCVVGGGRDGVREVWVARCACGGGVGGGWDKGRGQGVQRDWACVGRGPHVF